MELDNVDGLEEVSKTGAEISLVDIHNFPLSPYRIIDLEEDDVWVQRAITSDNRLVHVTEAMTVGRYDYSRSCVWAFKVILKKDGLFDFVKEINETIKLEYESRLARKKPYKRWHKNMRSLVVQLFIYDYELLMEALEDKDKFISKYVST